MIVKDEDKFLEKCLSGIKDLVDEIIIVDTGSKDTTVEIAKKFTTKIFSIEWPNSFAKARNFSLQKASGDWILILDADELISEKDFKKIKEIVKEDVDGYIILQRNYTNDTSYAGFIVNDNKYEESKNYLGYFHSPLVRLFKKGYVFEGKVHEAVEPSIERNNGKIVKTDIPIHHYGFIRKDKDKAQYLDLAKEKGTDLKGFFDVGMENMRNANYKEAVVAFRSAFQKDKDNARIAYNLAAAYLKDKNNEAAINHLELFLRENNTTFSENKKWKVDIYCNLAVAYQNTKQFDKALKRLKEGLDIDGNNINIVKNLGSTYFMMGNYKEAMRHFSILLKVIPKDSSLHYNLGLCFAKIGNKELMVAAFKKAIEYNHPNSEELKKLFSP